MNFVQRKKWLPVINALIIEVSLANHFPSFEAQSDIVLVSKVLILETIYSSLQVITCFQNHCHHSDQLGYSIRQKFSNVFHFQSCGLKKTGICKVEKHNTRTNAKIISRLQSV